MHLHASAVSFMWLDRLKAEAQSGSTHQCLPVECRPAGSLSCSQLQLDIFDSRVRQNLQALNVCSSAGTTKPAQRQDLERTTTCLHAAAVELTDGFVQACLPGLFDQNSDILLWLVESSIPCNPLLDKSCSSFLGD